MASARASRFFTACSASASERFGEASCEQVARAKSKQTPGRPNHPSFVISAEHQSLQIPTDMDKYQWRWRIWI